MSGKDSSVTSRASLMGTAPGRQIIRHGLLKTRGYRQFERYQKEAKEQFPAFAKRFASDMRVIMQQDPSPARTVAAFADAVGEPEMRLDGSKAQDAKARLADIAELQTRIDRILDSNFVKMTMPVFSALYDAAAEHDGRDLALKQDVIDGHLLAIDLSEPMDRIIDKDEDLQYLDDFRLLNPYILQLARKKIARGGDGVLKEFEQGFAQAQAGQSMDAALKSKMYEITSEEMAESYKKYRSVMGTAGKNMALAKSPLGEIFYSGMAHAAESTGCGNEIEDTIRHGFIKVPSWPLYYTLLSGSAKTGFECTMQKASSYLQDARLSLGLLPDGFSHREFLEFLFLTVDHYNQFWHGRLVRAQMWPKLESVLTIETCPGMEDVMGRGPQA